jgi:hypothetical protein
MLRRRKYPPGSRADEGRRPDLSRTLPFGSFDEQPADARVPLCASTSHAADAGHDGHLALLALSDPRDGDAELLDPVRQIPTQPRRRA